VILPLRRWWCPKSTTLSRQYTCTSGRRLSHVPVSNNGLRAQRAPTYHSATTHRPAEEVPSRLARTPLHVKCARHVAKNHSSLEPSRNASNRCANSSPISQVRTGSSRYFEMGMGGWVGFPHRSRHPLREGLDRSELPSTLPNFTTPPRGLHPLWPAQRRKLGLGSCYVGLEKTFLLRLRRGHVPKNLRNLVFHMRVHRSSRNGTRGQLHYYSLSPGLGF
jgi:hypothetical protein